MFFLQAKLVPLLSAVGHIVGREQPKLCLWGMRGYTRWSLCTCVFLVCTYVYDVSVVGIRACIRTVMVYTMNCYEALSKCLRCVILAEAPK